MDAISSYRTFLMHSTDGSSWTKLIDVQEYPQLGGAPEQLQTTTLSDNMHTYIAGIQAMSAMEFVTNYNLADYTTLKALEGKTEHYAVWFGGTGDGSSLTPTGEHGKYKCQGQLSVFINGGGVNEVVKQTISISPSTPIEPDTTT